jgi:hypothetical protein
LQPINTPLTLPFPLINQSNSTLLPITHTSHTTALHPNLFLVLPFRFCNEIGVHFLWFPIPRLYTLSTNPPINSHSIWSMTRRYHSG